MTLTASIWFFKYMGDEGRGYAEIRESGEDDGKVDVWWVAGEYVPRKFVPENSYRIIRPWKIRPRKFRPWKIRPRKIRPRKNRPQKHSSSGKCWLLKNMFSN